MAFQDGFSANIDKYSRQTIVDTFQSREQAIAYLVSVAIPYLDRTTPYDAFDKAWDSFIREWRKLPKRPRLRQPYEGLFGGGEPSQMRQQAKAIAIAMVSHLRSVQVSSPNALTESDQQTESFIKNFKELGAQKLDIIQPQPAQPSSKVVLPNFSGGNAQATRAAIIAECKRQGLPLVTQQAYVLATVEHETAGTWQPVREAFWQSEDWRSKNLWYYPYYGRGYVQITHRENYVRYEKIIGLPLASQADLAMRPDISLFILVHGCKHGTFTGRKIEDYINRSQTDYYHARMVINALDKASHIASLAEAWQSRIKQNAV